MEILELYKQIKDCFYKKTCPNVSLHTEAPIGDNGKIIFVAWMPQSDKNNPGFFRSYKQDLLQKLSYL